MNEYKKISKPEHFDVILRSNEGLVPDAIDWFQGNDFNHAGIAMYIYGKCYICEAISTGIALTPWEVYDEKIKSGEYVCMVLRTDKEEAPSPQSMAHFCLPYTSAGYEYQNLLIFQPVKYISRWFFMLIAKLEGKPYKGKQIWIGSSKENADKSFICGEWVMFVINNYWKWFNSWNQGAPADLFHENKFNLRFKFKQQKQINKN